MKKMMAAFLALVMCAALAVPALVSAADNDTTNYTVTLEEPTISVSVPTDAAVILNPYQIAVTNTTDLGATAATGSILAAKLFVGNKSNVPLKMSLVATGSIPDGSGATFATAAPASTEKNKKVFMFLEVGATVTEGAVPTAAALSTLTADDYDATNTKQCIIKAGDAKLTEVLDLPVPTALATGNYATIQVGGACSSSPTTAWVAADKVTLKVVFSFQASNNVASGT